MLRSKNNLIVSNFVFLVLCAFQAAPVWAAGKVETTVFGPATFFDIGNGKKQSKSFAIASTGLPFTLRFQNNGAQHAQIKLNGQLLQSNGLIRDPNFATTFLVTLKATNEVEVKVMGPNAQSSITLSITAEIGELPSDPASQVPPQDPTTALSFADGLSFLYSSPNPIQTGVTPGAIVPRRIAVIRGRVLFLDGSVAQGVGVTVLNHPEYGRTSTRADGWFDLAVSGGQTLSLVFTSPGALPVQRSVQVPWQNFVVLNDVYLTALDSKVSQVNFGVNSPTQFHSANPVADQDGSRQSTIIFPAGTSATLVLPDGTTQSVSSLSVRATEYTVGPNGPLAMPAELPGTSAYTFAVELSADEELAAGAVRVQFNHPVYHYVDNFLGFPVGTPVPLGFYDRVSARWVPGANGRVIKILSVSNGLANIDLSGAGIAASAVELSAMGFTAGERQTLASRFGVGKTLWRSPVPHFSTLDGNASTNSDGDTKDKTPEPTSEDKEKKEEPECNSCPCPSQSLIAGASVVDTLGQSLVERFPVVGTPYSLTYSSERNPGRLSANSLEIPITGATVSSSLGRVDLQISVGGRTFAYAFPPVPNQTFRFTWDGFDAYGRLVQGPHYAFVVVSFVNQTEYSVPLGDPAFAVPSQIGFATPIPSRFFNPNHNSYLVPIGAVDARKLSLGGLSLSVQHSYDPDSQTLYLGDGSKRVFVESDALGMWIFAGTGGQGSTGDEGPATEATLLPRGLAKLSDGSILIADGARLRRVDPSGFIHDYPFSGTLPSSLFIGSLAASNDSLLWVLDTDTQRLFRVQNQELLLAVDSGTFAQAKSVKAQADGTVYVADGQTVWQVPFAGAPVPLSGLESIIGMAQIADLAVTSNGSDLYLGLSDGHLWRVSSSARPTDLNPSGGLPIGAMALGEKSDLYFTAGANLFRVSGPTSFKVPLFEPLLAVGGLLVGPTGELYVSESFPRKVLRIDQTFPGAPAGVITIASKDGRELFDFDADGLHLQTRDALTNAVRVQFVYVQGRLQSIVDTFGNTTTIERDPSGNPTAIRSPDGLRTELTTNVDGYVSSIRNPNGEAHVLTYSPGTGLLTELQYPNPGEIGRHTFNSLGRLTADRDATGAEQTIVPQNSATLGGLSSSAAWTTAEGITTQVSQNIQVGQITQASFLPDGTSTVNQSDGITNNVLGRDATQTLSTQAPDPRFGTQSPFTSVYQTVMPSGLTQTFRTSKTVTYSPVAPPLVQTFTLDETTQRESTSGTVLGISTRHFDSATLTWTETSFAGRQSSTVLDPSGKIAQLLRPSTPENPPAPLAFSYDARGRLAAETQGNRQTTYSYNAQGFLESIQPPDIGPTRFTYDGAGRVVRTLLSDGVREMLKTYDANGNVSSISPPGRPAWFFTHDGVGNTTSFTPPSVLNGGGSTLYHYSVDRKLDRINRPDGGIVRLQYDAVSGKLASKMAPEGTTVFGYTPGFPYLTSVTNPSSPGQTQTITLSYDGSNPTGTQWSGEVVGLVSEVWDQAMESLSRTTAVGGSHVTITNQFDADGQSLGSNFLSLFRDPASGLITREQSNSPPGKARVVSDFAYNEFREQTGKTVTLFPPGGGPGTVAYQELLERDVLGRITKSTETILGVTHVYEYLYDPAGRLHQQKVDGIPHTTFVYDLNGNPVFASASDEGDVTFTYDAQDRLLFFEASDGTRTEFGYNANGETTSVGQGESALQLSYDSQGALIRVDLPGGPVIEYVMDGLGRRVGKKRNGSLVNGYLYDSQNRVVAVTDGQGALLQSFTYTSQAHMFEQVDTGTNSDPSEIVTDIRGTPVLQIFSNGATRQFPHEFVFGENDTNEANSDITFGFAGCLRDPDVPICHFGARDYASGLARWLQRDPIGFRGGPNLYGYSLQDPINNIDPDGLAALTCQEQAQIDRDSAKRTEDSRNANTLGSISNDISWVLRDLSAAEECNQKTTARELRGKLKELRAERTRENDRHTAEEARIEKAYGTTISGCPSIP